jgi:signal transduction histidine kinase
MLVSIVFSVAFYQVSTNEIGAGFDRQALIFRQLPNGNPMNPFPNLENLRSEQLEASSSRLKIDLIYLNLGILILSSIGGYFLAKRTLKPMEDAMDSQNRFTADASHELRTPLTAMKTEIEVNLRDKNLSLPEAQSLLKSNLEEIGKLEYLSNALLKLARFEDNSGLNLEKVSLPEVIREAVKKVYHLSGKKAIKFKLDLQKAKIQGDKESLVELFVILLDNAVKYSFDNSEIVIKLKKINNKVLVEVVDQGAGIAAADLPYIFDRFYRADTSRSKNKIDGHGLGLAIAKRIVELHDGTISVKSKLGKGTVFYLKFNLE